MYKPFVTKQSVQLKILQKKKKVAKEEGRKGLKDREKEERDNQTVRFNSR